MIKIKNNTFFYKFFFYTYDKYVILENIILIERYIRRKFGYCIVILINTNAFIKYKKITINRSPVMHKISREQFKFSYFKLCLTILLRNYLVSSSISFWLFKYLKFFFFNHFFLLSRAIYFIKIK